MCSVGGGVVRAFRIGRQRAGHQLEAIVHARRDAMHAADEGARAAHHAQPQPPGVVIAGSSGQASGHGV